jgi:hypothetical protein
VRKISLEHLYRFLVEVDGRETLKFRPFHAKAKTAASAKKVYECVLQIF